MSLFVLTVMGGDHGTGLSQSWVTHDEVAVWDPYKEEDWLPALKAGTNPKIVHVTNLFWWTQDNWTPNTEERPGRQREWTLRTRLPNEHVRGDEFEHRFGHFMRVCKREGVWDRVHAVDPGPDEPFGRAWTRTQAALAQDIRTVNAYLAEVAPGVQRLVCHAIGEFDPSMQKIELMRGFRAESLGYTLAGFDVYSDTRHSDEDFARWLRAFKVHYPVTPILLVADGVLYATDTKESKLERIEKFRQLAVSDPQILGLRIYRWLPSDGHVPAVGALSTEEWLRDAWAKVGQEAKANFDRLVKRRSA